MVAAKTMTLRSLCRERGWARPAVVGWTVVSVVAVKTNDEKCRSKHNQSEVLGFGRFEMNLNAKFGLKTAFSAYFLHTK